MIVIDTFNPVTNPIRSMQVPTGKFDFFLFYITGTTGAGETLAATDNVGTITMRITNELVVQSSFTGMFNLTQKLGGAPAQITPAAGATELSCAVMSTPDRDLLPNSWLCERDGNINLQWNSGADLLSKLDTSPLCQVYGVYSDSIPFFVWQQSELLKNFPVGGPTPFDLPQLYNVTDIFLRPATPANVARITAKRGDRVFADGSFGSLIAMSNIVDRVELGQVAGTADTAAATPDYVHLTPANPYNLGSMVGAEVSLLAQVQTGATDIYALYCAARLMGSRSQIGKAAQEALVASKLRALPPNQQRNFFVAAVIQSGGNIQQAEALAKTYGF